MKPICHNMVHRFAIAVSFVAILLLSINLQAQETRGTIRGTVIDANNASLPGATVKIIDAARGSTATFTTNSEGIFQATYLLPGKYQIIVEANGFKKYIRDNVVLQINQTINLDISLEVGGAQETVTVTTDTPVLETAKADLGQTVDGKRIAELPLVHGDPYVLIGLSPGATYTGSTRLDRPFEPTHIVGFAMDGTRGNRSDLTIDGAPSTATANANEVIASYVPPTDIIQEFKVQTATFDAQFGNTEGGVTSISIKSGTNALHGTAYYWTEPGGIAANDFFGNSRVPFQGRPFTFSNRPGFSVNGPVRIPYLYNGKDKTFFLFGFEAIRDSRPRFDAGGSVYVPTQAMRNGDFTATGITIYDPLTRVTTGGTSTQTAFAGNIIPQSRINPVSKALLQYWALPKRQGTGALGLAGNIFDSTLAERTNPYNNWTFRVDQVINDKNRLFVRGSYYDRESHYNDYFGTIATGVNFIFKARQGVIDDVHTFNSTTVLNVRYGYNRFIRGQDQEPDARGFDLTSVGFPAYYNNLIPEEMRRFPRFDFPANSVLGTGFGNEFRPVDTHSYSAILNKTWNTHSMKFGGELRVYREDSSFNSNDQTGQFIFDNLYTRQSSASAGSADAVGVQAFAAFLLGYPTTTQIVRRADYSEYSKTWGFFFQDDWRVNNKLSLNLGLRFEFEQALIERNNKSVSGFDFDYTQPIEAAAKARLIANPVTGVDPNTFNVRGGLLFAGLDTGSELYNTPKSGFLPRFGLAYQLNNKTVIRGGFGMFQGFLGQRRGDVIQPGYTQTTVAALTTNANGAQIPYTLSTPFANTTILEPVGNARGRQTGLGGGISFFNQNPKVSKQARWQVGIQRELPWGFVAEAVYVGNHGFDIEIVRNINALPNRYLSTLPYRDVANNTFLTATVSNPFQGLLPGTGFNNATIARSQLLRPFPAFGDINTSVNDGKSWYHSGQFTLQKRFSHGYTVQASYTWSKWIQQTEYLNAGDELPTKMISDQDVPHRFSFSSLYAFPFGKGQRFLSNPSWLVNALVGGWQVQGVYVYQSGFPVGFTTNYFFSAAGGEIAVNNPTVAGWFNPSAFNRSSANDATGQPVNNVRTNPLRFSNVRLDAVNNVDLSLLKDIRLRENMKIQLRMEFINAFNHPLLNANLVVNPTSSDFGKIVASNQNNYARRAQLGVKFVF